nr:hypothetical protein [uncultured bacterium]
MNIRKSAIMLLIILCAAQIFTYAQNGSDLTTLGDRVVSYIESQKPDWKYESVQPTSGSGDVLIQQWTLDNRSVRIAIVSHKSTQDAAAAISRLAREGQANEAQPGLGDEGMVWGRGVVSFRKRNFTIDISAANTEPVLDLSEAAKNTADERKLAKEFAQLVSSSIKDKF